MDIQGYRDLIRETTKGGAFGIGIAAALAVAVWLASTTMTQVATVVGDGIRHGLKIEETKYEQTLKAALDFKGRQLAEFYWPIFVRLQKDTAIWDRMADRSNPDQTLRKIGLEVENKEILPNHEEIVRIIENKIHLSQADSELQTAMMRYIRHVAVYKALRSAGVTDKDPIAYGEKWPDDFVVLMKQRTERLQSEYDSLLKSAGLVK